MFFALIFCYLEMVSTAGVPTEERRDQKTSIAELNVDAIPVRLYCPYEDLAD